MRIWLHEWKGNEWGWSAWSLAHIGFATWAPTRDEVLGRAPGKLAEYLQWLTRHGSDITEAVSTETIVVEEISGNEVAFVHDLAPAAPEEIARCQRFLEFSRQDVLDAVKDLPDALLDWDPPYQHYAEWARWRSIRQILTHIAATEVGYYLPVIGYSRSGPSELAGKHWREQLSYSRRETEQFLAELADSRDRARVTKADEVWSVRKVLRRLVWHDLLHWKSIKRIVREYGAQGDQPVHEADGR